MAIYDILYSFCVYNIKNGLTVCEVMTDFVNHICVLFSCVNDPPPGGGGGGNGENGKICDFPKSVITSLTVKIGLFYKIKTNIDSRI